MAELLDLLSIYPVLSQLVPQISLGDLVNLSRVNSTFRAVLHGFPLPNLRWGKHPSIQSFNTKTLLGMASHCSFAEL